MSNQCAVCLSAVMDDEEAQHVLNTHDFQQFFDGASLLVERVRADMGCVSA